MNPSHLRPGALLACFLLSVLLAGCGGGSGWFLSWQPAANAAAVADCYALGSSVRATICIGSPAAIASLQGAGTSACYKPEGATTCSAPPPAIVVSCIVQPGDGFCWPGGSGNAPPPVCEQNVGPWKCLPPVNGEPVVADFLGVQGTVIGSFPAELHLGVDPSIHVAWVSMTTDVGSATGFSLTQSADRSSLAVKVYGAGELTPRDSFVSNRLGTLSID